jgi:hypothetical protein
VKNTPEGHFRLNRVLSFTIRALIWRYSYMKRIYSPNANWKQREKKKAGMCHNDVLPPRSWPLKRMLCLHHTASKPGAGLRCAALMDMMTKLVCTS